MLKDNTTMMARQSATSTFLVPNLIVAPDWLAPLLEHPALCLLDVRLPESYDKGHIPGAISVDLHALNRPVNGVKGMLLPPDLFAEQMGRLGASRKSTVIIYDGNWGMPAARVLWSLACYGHNNAAVLSGGSDRWQEDGRPWTSVPSIPRPGQFVVHLDGDHAVEGAWLRARLDHQDIALVDTRTPGEYAQGHLPGAIHWDWMNGVPVKGWDTLRPAAELLSELTDLGVTPDKEVITYCLSGVRAAHTYLLLRTLGYPRVRVYDGSWLEWSHNDGNKPATEVSLGG